MGYPPRSRKFGIPFTVTNGGEGRSRAVEISLALIFSDFEVVCR
jgi:hypothetical protein